MILFQGRESLSGSPLFGISGESQKMQTRTALRLSLLAGTALISVATAHSANAAGFYIQEQSVSAGGAAYAGAATNTKDASTIFFNPAGVTKLSGAQAHAGVQVLVPNGELKNKGSTFPGGQPAGGDGGNPYNPTPVPAGFAAMPVSAVDGLWIGIGVTAPFGLANKYDSDYFGRFDSRKTDLLTMDIQPTIAYKVNDWLSLGGGLNIQRADATLTNAIFFGAGTVGTSKLEGDDWGFGYTAGAQIELTPATTLGLNYRSSISYDLKGKITIDGAPAGTSVTTIDNASASLVTPDKASIGLSHDLNDKWTIMGQANWMGWNNFDNITARNSAGVTQSAVEQNYQAVWSYALGAEYNYSPDWTFRGGIQYDNTPTTDEFRTTRTPDGDRTWFATGATYKFSEQISLDMNLTYIHIADEEIDVTRNAAAPSRIIADTSGDVWIGGLGVNYKF